MNNGPLNTDCQVLIHAIASSIEAELGSLFNNGQTAIPLSTTIKELKHQQPPTPIKNRQTHCLRHSQLHCQTKNPKQWT